MSTPFKMNGFSGFGNSPLRHDKKDKDVLPWKDFNKNMAVSVEYNLEY